MGKTTRLLLDEEQRAELAALLERRALRANHARRATVVLLAAEGVPGVEIARRLGLSVSQVSRIRKRFERGQVAGLADRPKSGRKDHAVSGERVAQIVSLASSPPPDGCRRWSTRMIGARVGLTSSTVAKILRQRGLASARRGSSVSGGSALPG